MKSVISKGKADGLKLYSIYIWFMFLKKLLIIEVIFKILQARLCSPLKIKTTT